MAEMRVFTCKGFKGHWPVPTAAAVVAEDLEQARYILDEALEERGLELEGDEEWEELEIVAPPRARILSDGNY